MRKHKNLLAKALILLLALSLLAGCSSSNDTNDSTSTDPSTSSVSKGTVSPEKPVKLHFLSWQSDQKAQDQEVADAYNKLHPNITVEIEYVGDQSSEEYMTKTDLMVMGGEDIDILMAPEGGAFTMRANSGLYLPLDSYAQKEGIDLQSTYSGIFPVNDAIYGLTGDMKSFFVIINKDMLDAAGLPVPPLDWTWDDYREYAKKLTHGEGADKVYGSYFHSWSTYNMIGMYSVKKDHPLFETETEPSFENPYFKQWMEFRYSLENVEKVSTPYADVKALNMAYRDRFFNGYCAMVPIGSYMISEIGQQDKFPHDFVTTFAPLPHFEGSDLPSGATDCSNLFYAIAKTSKNPQETYDFLRFYTTEGIDIKGKSIPTIKGIDKMKAVNKMIENEEYYDVEALENVLNNPNWYDNTITFFPIYASKVDDIMKEECDKYLLNTLDIDTVIANIMSRSNKVIDEALKENASQK